ncbi:hypothetical protein MATL_G00065800 [Megalops atlanticus]|uniref:Chemokine interleukin-8-like domain-containing protein n=1 Tax=Megalops atlanticus TaxID=7932 RepID=A0A9D3Q8U4_MEGAT|nr:hypothetical protein MATL_G00065800 [Megalops atlanticus]
MRSMFVLFLCTALMVTTIIEAHPMSNSQRCLCEGTTQASVAVSNVQAYKVYPESLACDRIEILVQLKTGRVVCLNPNSKIGQVMKQRARVI